MMKLWWGCLLLPVLSHAQLMTPDEAEAAGDVVCRPADKGLLECRKIELQPATGGNDPSIIPLPSSPPTSGERFGAVVDEMPSQPVLDLLPQQLPARTATLAWDVGWGNVGDYWEVWDNGQLLLRSREFTRRRIGGEYVESAENLAQPRFEAVQSGLHTVERLSDGRHEFVIKLCKGGDKPKCSVARTTTWVGADGGATGDPDATPSKPELAWMPQITTGEAIDVRWNLWWGEPGTYWQLLSGGKKVFESRQFAENDAHSQAGTMTLSGLAAGKHSFSVRLCRKLACAESDPVTVEVLLPLPLDIKPRVVVRRVNPDTVILGWSVPRLAYSQPPASWQLRDGNGSALGEPSRGVRECDVPDATHDGVMVASYCGDIRLEPAALPAQVAVSVCDVKENCADSLPVVPQELADGPVVPAAKAPEAVAQPVEAEVPASTGRLVVPEDSLLDPGAAQAPRVRNRR